MDIATVIGLVAGALLILSAILMGGSAGIFINIPGLLIVVGGTLATCFIKFSMKDVVNTMKVVMKAFLFKMEAPEDIIKDMVGYAKLAKKNGLIALEKEKPKDEFVAKSLRYMADGYDEALVQDMLKRDIRLTVQRHLVGQSIFKGMGDAAPAFGMIGTLIGLIVMLGSMDDPSQMGPGLSMALMTTLYGVLAARFVFQPCSTKVRQLLGIQRFREYLILEGLMLILNKRSTFYIQDRLNSFLDRKNQYSMESAGEGK